MADDLPTLGDPSDTTSTNPSVPVSNPKTVIVSGRQVVNRRWYVIERALQMLLQGISGDYLNTHDLQLSLIDSTPVNPTPPSPTPVNPTPPSPTPGPDSWEKTLLDLHNQARGGLPPLQISPKLDGLATGHSEYMAKTGVFDHDEPGNSFTNRVSNAGLSIRSAGENIAMGFPDPQSVIQGWLQSPGHKRNIMDPNFNSVGFGRVTSTQGNVYWTADFVQLVSADLKASEEVPVYFSGGLILRSASKLPTFDELISFAFGEPESSLLAAILTQPRKFTMSLMR